MNSFSDIWQAVCSYVKTNMNINSAAYTLWFEPVRPVSFDGTTVTLACNNQFKMDILKEKYADTLKTAFSVITGFDDLEFEFILNEMPEKQPEPAVASNSGAVSGGQSTFENFIVGSTNKFAYAVAVKVAENPGAEYNPLFIYGKSGLGKTHLLKAIEYRMRQNNPTANVLYTTSENFTNDLIYHLETKNMSEFHNKYRTLDALLIDDIQFIANKKSTEEEFFHTFNALTEIKKQIVLTSDNPPDEIPTLQERLKTRFKWGIMADITPPDFETRMAIIKSKADYYHLELPNTVIEFISEQVKHNVRQIEGAVNKLNAIKNLTGNDITFETAKEAVKEIMNLNQPVSVTTGKIIENVGNTFGVTPANILSDKRDKNIKDARQISMYIIREITGMSLEDIGKLFGGKTHSTVKHSLDVVSEKMDANNNFKKTIEDIIKNVQEF